MDAVRASFHRTGDGPEVVRAHTRLVDEIVTALWLPQPRCAVLAVGGYGRRELYPHSDIDLLFCVERGAAPKEAIRQLSQALWDHGLRVSPQTRMLADCERFDAANAELAFALLDRRFVTGDDAIFAKLEDRLPKGLLDRDAKSMRTALLDLTRERHKKYGDTLFHLEPQIKDCPGGLRDAHAAQWLGLLGASAQTAAMTLPSSPEFTEATRFLASARCFLHFRRGRDDNTLDWPAQDEAARLAVGLGGEARAAATPAIDPSHWMRAYFRHARVVERALLRAFEASGLTLHLAAAPRRFKLPPEAAFRLHKGRFELAERTTHGDASAGEPATVLALFAAVAQTGAPLTHATEQLLTDAIPLLSAHLEDGPALWRAFAAVLTGPSAGFALRSMHELGILDLILPEFHGIDALVIRDAYHRYTVDEHTFVLIDTLHALEREPPPDAPEWRVKLGQMARELAHPAALYPAALYLAALLHDTGKGRAGGRHAQESVRLAEGVLDRWQLDGYEASLVLALIDKHLEMSAALRRDIFDRDTVRRFAATVQTHELLRRLTLFTYADIQAVHPDALTPWKAENLWRLSMNAGNQMDRGVDEERLHLRAGEDDRIARIAALTRLPHAVSDSSGDRGVSASADQVRGFLEGFPERYLATRTPQQIAAHFALAAALEREPVQIRLLPGAATSEVIVVTRDRPSLFAGIAGTLAAWGMNVITADAFANAGGIVVDSFRFTDTFQTFALNASEIARFTENLKDVLLGNASVEKMLAGRRRGRRAAPRRVVPTRIDFDASASGASTLVQIVTQDLPGLLRALSATLDALGCNVEVALIDTEGDMAIDVFYITRHAAPLGEDDIQHLHQALIAAIDENAGN